MEPNAQDIDQDKVQKLVHSPWPETIADMGRNLLAICCVLVFTIAWGFVSAGISCFFEFAYSQPSAGGTVFQGQLSYGTTLYFTFINLTTVGFGDIAPWSDGARILAVINAMLGIVLFACVTGLVVLSFSPRESYGSSPSGTKHCLGRVLCFFLRGAKSEGGVPVDRPSLPEMNSIAEMLSKLSQSSSNIANAYTRLTLDLVGALENFPKVNSGDKVQIHENQVVLGEVSRVITDALSQAEKVTSTLAHACLELSAHARSITNQSKSV
jgi:hypothetical protein